MPPTNCGAPDSHEGESGWCCAARPVEDYIAVLESNLEEIDRMSRIVEELLFLRGRTWARSKQNASRSGWKR